MTGFARRTSINGPFDDMLMFNEYEDLTNIKINWNDISDEGFVERKQLEFTSNNLPDFFFRTDLNPYEVIEYGSEGGILIPLEGLIEDYAPNISALLEEYPEVRDGITAPDGHIYNIPGIVTLDAARNEKLWINQTWLDELGLEIPETQEELEEVLRAFKEEDPAGNGETIPMMMMNWIQMLGTMAGMYGLDSQMGYDINIDGDDIELWRASEDAREGYEWLHEMYSEGLIDNRVFSQTYADFVAEVSSGNVGIFRNQATDIFTEVVDDYVGMSPVEGPHGDRGHWSGSVGRDFGAFAISAANKYPAETIRWLDYFYGEEGSIFYAMGVEGETFEYDEDGNAQYIGSNDASEVGQFTPWPGNASPYWTNEKNSPAIYAEADKKAQEAVAPYMSDIVYPAPIIEMDTAIKLDEMRQDIDPYFDESFAEFINGDRPLNDEEWEKFVDTMYKLGQGELEEIYQEIFLDVFK